MAKCGENGCNNKRQGRTVWCWQHMTAWTRQHLLGNQPTPADEPYEELS
jgi:hypothetical protein